MRILGKMPTRAFKKIKVDNNKNDEKEKDSKMLTNCLYEHLYVNKENVRIEDKLKSLVSFI